MEKPPLNEETWSLVKWALGIMSGIILTAGRWFFGDIRDVQKKHDERFDKVDERLGKIETRLIAVEEIREYLHAIKAATAFQEHVKRQTKKRDRRMKRLEKQLV
jgi:hypothetical protein